MPRKGEHIHKRKDGRWEGRYRNGTDINGKAKYSSVYGKTYSEVKKKLFACVEIKTASDSHVGKSLLFRDAVLLWQKATAVQHKGATNVKYDNLITKHILPVLGNYELSELSTGIIADFMNSKLNAGRLDNSGGLSPSYVRSIMLIVIDVIDFAIEEGMCPPIKLKIRKRPLKQTSLKSLILQHRITSRDNYC